MDRWARGDELACSGRKGKFAGGCRNLATWLIRSDLYPRNYMSCNLHRDSTIRLLTKRKQVYRPEVVPFQDPNAKPPGKTNRIRNEEN